MSLHNFSGSVSGAETHVDVMLCDYAQVSAGKLTIVGGGIDRIGFPLGAPPPYAAVFYAAGLVHMPWEASVVEHHLDFQVVTEDGTLPLLPGPEGPQLTPVSGGLTFSLMDSPGATPGAVRTMPFVFAFNPLPLMAAGRFAFVLSVDDDTVASLPFTLAGQ